MMKIFLSFLTLVLCPFITAQENVINIEVDWMEGADHNHRMSDCEMQSVIDAFAANGWTLNIEWSNSITEDADNMVLEINQIPLDSNPEWAALSNANRNHAPGTGWHYAILGHEYDAGAGVGSSGVAELDGDDFLVSLGGWENDIGLPFQRSGTFMHELGHNLGLRHGGNEDHNYKPNYTSIMNYLYQLGGVRSGLACRNWQPDGDAPLFILDYSHGNRPDINENSLLESNGIGFGEIDWNCNGQIDANSFSQSISGDHSHGVNWCNSPSTPKVISDFADWRNIATSARQVNPGSALLTCMTRSEFLANDPCNAPGAATIVDPCNLGENRDLLAVVIDRTGSMSVGGPPDRCASAETRAIDQIRTWSLANPDGLIAVWTFNGSSVPQLTSGFVDGAAAQAAVGNIGSCTGSTPLADALCVAIHALEAATDGNRHLVFLTDGEENNSKGDCSGPPSSSPVAPYDLNSWHRKVRDRAIDANIKVDVDFYGPTVRNAIDVETGLDISTRDVSDNDFFSELSEATGGVYHYFDDDGLSAVPTLGEWGLFLLIAGLAVLMLVARRRSLKTNFQ